MLCKIYHLSIAVHFFSCDHEPSFPQDHSGRQQEDPLLCVLVDLSGWKKANNLEMLASAATQMMH